MNRSAASVSVSARPHRLDRHRLAEGNGRRLDPTAAGAAHRCRPVAFESDTQFSDLVPLRALETVRIGRVAVQFDHLRGRNAGGLMEPVDVLGDNRSSRTAANELGNGAVTAVRLCSAPGIVSLEAAPPSFAPGFARRRGNPRNRSASSLSRSHPDCGNRESPIRC